MELQYDKKKIKKITLVDKSKGKSKKKKINFGFEYDPLIKNDKDLCQKIFNDNLFLVEFDYIFDIEEKIRCLYVIFFLF